MTIRVDVTQADIDGGLSHMCERCPVALAAARAMPHIRGVFVAATFIGLGADPGRRIALPAPARAFVRDFDAGRPVAPFSFDLEA